MKKIDEKIDINGYFFISYLIPLVSSISISMIITGSSNWGPYQIQMNGIQVRIVGIFIFIFCSSIFYTIIIKWPKSLDRDELKYTFIKKLIFSPFFITWLLSIISLIFFKLFVIEPLIYLYLILIIINFYFLKQFLKEIKELSGYNV